MDDADLMTALGVSAIVQARQVHGARVVEASEAAGAEADAVVGRMPPDPSSAPIAVGVRVADCVPVLLADRTTGAVAAVHAGWRGVVAGVVAAGVAGLVARGEGRSSDVVASIGPCIGPCCFEVGVDVAEAIARASGGSSVVARPTGAKAYVDLRSAVRAQLALAGVGGARVDDVDGCTKHEPSRFHSFRRDGANSGRMLAAIVARRYG